MSSPPNYGLTERFRGIVKQNKLTRCQAVVAAGLASIALACSSRRPVGATPAVVEHEKVGTAECLVPRLISGRAEEGSFAFVPAEYAWLRKTYPGFRLIDQSLVMASDEAGGERDELNIMTADGQSVSVCFFLFFSDSKGAKAQ